MRALLLLAVLLPAVASAAPVRVVSLNLCTDQMLVRLAPARVAALSWLARDPALSEVAEVAGAMPWVRADAEAVLALHPDLVLGATFGAQATLAALSARGVPVERLAPAPDFAAIRVQTLRLGALLDARDAAEAWLRQMDGWLGQGRPRPVRAMMWQPRGFTAGPDSLGQQVMRAAGMTAMGAGRPVGLEALLADPPDLLIVTQRPQFPSLATDLAQHPALARIPRIAIPPALLICATPDTARAVALLRR